MLYSELEVGRRYRLYDCDEIWTKRMKKWGKGEDDYKFFPLNNFPWNSQSVQVHPEPIPFVCDGCAVFRYEEILDFYGYSSESVIGQHVIVLDGVACVFVADIVRYEQDRLNNVLDGELVK